MVQLHKLHKQHSILTESFTVLDAKQHVYVSVECAIYYLCSINRLAASLLSVSEPITGYIQIFLN